MPLSVTIKLLLELEDLQAVEEIQRRAWDMTPGEIVPAHLLRTIVHTGGLVLGAYVNGSDLAGFVFGFVGRASAERAALMQRDFFHVSEMVGVLQEYRGQGIARKLKHAQHAFALGQDYRLAIWTYDPLLALNAHLNINRLGATCRHYIRNCYGEMTGINAGLPSDRFEVEWWLASNHITQAMHNEPSDLATRPAQPVNVTTISGGTFPAPPDQYTSFDASHLLVEIPPDFDAIKAADIELAKAWRFHAREVFETAFDADYMIAGLSRTPERTAYILTNQLDLTALARGEDS